ncbi:Transcription factor BIM2-like protein [Drosera capensis]
MKQSSRPDYSHKEEEEYDDDFSARKEPHQTMKDAKSSDKARVVRSKHSMLRDLVPQADQKRDTASFLLEVIEYVQMLQEKVQNYEGSYPGWSGEPTKLMPWRHSHWRVQSFLGLPQAIKTSPEPGTVVPAKLDERSVGISPSMRSNTQAPVVPGSNQGVYRPMDHTTETAVFSMPIHVAVPTPVQNDGTVAYFPARPVSDAQPTDRTMSDDGQQEPTIEGGTINISSAYSDQQASLYVLILENELTEVYSGHPEHVNSITCDGGVTRGMDGSNGEGLEQNQKRLRL